MRNQYKVVDITAGYAVSTIFFCLLVGFLHNKGKETGSYFQEGKSSQTVVEAGKIRSYHTGHGHLFFLGSLLGTALIIALVQIRTLTSIHDCDTLLLRKKTFTEKRSLCEENR